MINGIFYNKNWELLSDNDLNKLVIIYGININQDKKNIINDILERQIKLVTELRKNEFKIIIGDGQILIADALEDLLEK